MKYILLLLLSALALGAVAQTPEPPDTLLPCGVTSSFMEKNIDPQLLKQMNAQWQAYGQQNKANEQLSNDDPVLVVPVMFHIAHRGEGVGTGSNISEGQIQTALATLNTMYRARGKYAAANDTRIEFVLANCSGVDRADASGVPNFLGQGVIWADGNQQQQVRALFGTYQDKFVNIYVSHAITGAGGFAYYGGDMFITVATFSKSGSTYTSSLLFAHEMGHSLFLYHTFQGDNSCISCSDDNVVCPLNDNPISNGDQVADTPPHRVFDLTIATLPEALNICTGEPFGIGLVKNHMAYYTDANRFTPGQIIRMRFYLENYLTKWLNSDAIPTPNDQLSFSSVPTSVCANSTVTVEYSNNSGSGNPVFLIQKGDDVAQYVDVADGLVNFTFPTTYFNSGEPLPGGGDYRIRVVAGCNSHLSAPIQYNNPVAYQAFVVGADGEQLPTISTDGYLYLCNSSSITLKAKLTSAQNGAPVSEAEQSGLNFQWTLDGNPIQNANQNSYTASGLSGTYRYILTVPGCSNQSTTSYGIDTRFDQTPSVYTGDLDNGRIPLKSQCLGSSLRLYSTYVSNSAVYTWYRDGLLIPGETGRSLMANSTGSYKVVPTDGSCYINSMNNKEVAVRFGNSLENFIQQPEDSIVCGTYAFLSTMGWAEGLSYQWLRNGTEVSNGSQSYFYTQEAGTYSVRLTQGSCSSVSNAVHLYKASREQKPVIIAPATFTDGLSYYLFVSYPDHYQQWYKDGQPAQDGYSNTLKINTSGVYTARKGSGGCMTESDPLVVNFGNTLSPVIITPDSVRLLCNNSSTVPLLSFENKFIESTSPLSYRWTKDGVDLTNIYADKNAIYASEDGVYRLRVSLGAVTGISNPITVSSTQNRIVRLAVLEGVRSACEGSLIKLSLPQISLYRQDNLNNLYLDWKIQGVTIPDQHRTELLASQSGSYTATYQGDGCTITTEPKQVIVANGSLTATLSGDEAIRAGGSANLLLKVPAGFDSFFQLSDGSAYASQDSTTLIPKSPALSTTYTLTSFGTHCGPGTALGVGRIDVTNCPVDAVNYTLGSGFWDNTFKWSCGSIPTVLDPVRISDAHTVYLPANYEAKSKSIELLGNIQQETHSNLRLGQK